MDVIRRRPVAMVVLVGSLLFILADGVRCGDRYFPDSRVATCVSHCR
jgi:hypothetical protein